MRASVLLELGLEGSHGDDAVGLADAVRLTAETQLRERALPVDGLAVDVAARRVVLRLPLRPGEGAGDANRVGALQAVLNAIGQDCAWNQRPLEHSLRWLVALDDSEVLPLTLGQVAADRVSRGHARLAPGPVTIASAADHAATLSTVHVTTERARRERDLRAALAGACRQHGVGLAADAGLLAYWAACTEAPRVEGIELGDAVDTHDWPPGLAAAVLAECVDGFAGLDVDTGALRTCLVVVDGAAGEGELEGAHARVLAELGRAAAMVERDRARPLQDLARALAERSYHPRLGSLADKQQRVLALALTLAEPPQRALLYRLAPWMGAEAATEVVGAYPFLREGVGCWLAQTHAVSPLLGVAMGCDAPLPEPLPDALEGLGVRLRLAAAFDTLVGAYLAGVGPSGTADLLGVRAAARQFVRQALDDDVDVDVSLEGLLRVSLAGHTEVAATAAGAAAARARSLLRRELRARLSERLALDVCEAVVAAWDDGFVRDLRERAEGLRAFASTPQGRTLVASLKRCHSLTRDVHEGSPNPAALDTSAAQTLWDAHAEVDVRLQRALEARDTTAALEALAVLAEPLSTMLEEPPATHSPPACAEARLRLLATVEATARRLAHFHLLSEEWT